jgi:energy-coupling factor transporter ATP-binding protein EcfA2
MKVNYPPYAVMNLIHDIIDRIAFARELSIAAGVKIELLNLYNEVESGILELKATIDAGNFLMEYTNQLATDLNKIAGAFPQSYGTRERGTVTLQEVEKPTFKNQQERYEPEIQKALQQFKTTAAFFTKLDFLNRDLVIIGANGSGKTSLAKHFITRIKNNGILISAQRVLILPAYDSIRSYTTTADHVKSIQLPSEELMNRENFAEEFGILIEHLLADDARALKQNRSQRDNPLPPPTKLQVLLMMWNSLFSHLQISLPDDINIEAKKDSLAFHVSEMSDGEKVALFLTAHVLLCPENGFVIVDEPEMHLHPTIHKKLWDRLESERSDLIFIYMTHDLDFASSRVDAKKLWLRSFAYPDQFQLEEIPRNELPQSLLMELLGSSQNILFCEGEVGSLDEQVYNILFPKYTIKPVGGCLSVINFTKAFNKLPMSARKANGIIDGDYISQERIQSLQGDTVFTLTVPHVENLLLDEALVSKLAKELSQDKQVIEIQKRVLVQFKEQRDSEIAKYVSAKVDHYFKDSNVAAGNSTDTIKSNFEAFIGKVDIDGWVLEHGEKIDKVIATEDYAGALKIFKNKGLASLANSAFRIKNFNQRAIELLRRDSNLQVQLRKNLPGIP